MSGHSKWKQIKHKKALADQGRGKLFSKLAKTIAAAARNNPDPKFNPTLRSAIEQAKRQKMPQANIERAISRASEAENQEELLLEIYGPEGVGVLVEVITDSRNRSIAEIKSVLKEHGAKIAEPGSLIWAFEKIEEGYRAKFAGAVSDGAKRAVTDLVSRLEEREDVVGIYFSFP
ncbi:MAG: YebC/PmpR family DNA-binding transcriptional regulator [Candidatus Colwellbacteria bacterium]|nr:YebC/PmpR family DNA-binding transcriptional regulator [Candidatus Colwellbacteria bacterium]